MDLQQRFKEVNDDEIEIDLKALFLKFKSLWYVLVIGFLVGTIAGVLYYAVLSTPMYESSSLVYLRSSSKTISLQDLQLSSNLTQDYEIIFKSRPNMEGVINDLSLDYTYEQLSNLITVTNPDNTRILKVTVKSANPNEAKNIANKVVEYGMDNIREIDSQEPYLVEKAIANTKRIGASLIKLAAIGALVGLFIVGGVIFALFILNDTFTSVDEIESTLGLPVLAVIAEDKSLAYAKRTKRKKKKGSATRG